LWTFIMPGLFTRLGFLVAQDAGGASNWSGLLMLLPIPFLFYFLIWLPQQQQEKKRRAMIDALKKNDKVVTAGGIYGTVVSVDQAADKVVLRIDDDKGVKLTTTRSSVVRVIDSGAEKGADGS
jgi:preprotein translocase subunit YajC